MIILDTHIWIWWVDENPKLSPQNREIVRIKQAVWELVLFLAGKLPSYAKPHHLFYFPNCGKYAIAT